MQCMSVRKVTFLWISLLRSFNSADDFVTGLWSLIKRAPKAKIKRKTFEVPGPGVDNSMPLDARARQIFSYFKKYNYSVLSTGEVITFEGAYQASFGTKISSYSSNNMQCLCLFILLKIPLMIS
jgi:hypothetical protein